MMKNIFASLALFAYFYVRPTLAATYGLTDSWTGSAFFSEFTWENIPDPTNGRVNYLDQATSRSLGLATVDGEDLILRSDHTTVLTPGGPGRNSFRIRSNKVFTTHVAVFNIKHMPQGCGTWPAVWEVTKNTWPDGGEIDILEGVNDQGPNVVSLHTSPGCTMPANRVELGEDATFDCNIFANSNSGCGTRVTDPRGYGPEFNANGGGWYAIERTPAFIKVWFWSNSDLVPNDVRNSGITVNTDGWGTPWAFFPNTQCNLEEHFDEHFIVVNLTFCGDFAGAVYPFSGCPSTCNDFVENNPNAFNEAFFTLGGIRVFGTQ
ncbi:hypothetical protein PC9H_004509 [Pleurotus ostreatus]|uniref:GH16 domain-containing protein n=3 Tax=Pleurotus TaxID=5320 RepID=A0A8H6ZYQ7_PLEOS|nr:uncharacterized protein PC9H_004509 [Pleurotus ostreatus]KAF7432568.1 hypothetical protein PC9H_004509 [Pleurotus ostreatus]KAJ8698944.1 hypothetical protein PTI98_005597 [Pleurotus ostreatus]